MKIIEILIALVLSYAILSILVSILLEAWNNRQKSRGRLLYNAITKMLNDDLNLNYGYLLINHPLLGELKQRNKSDFFQYLEPELFADALIDVIGKQAKGAENNTDPIHPFQQFIAGTEAMNNSPFKELLINFYRKHNNNDINTSQAYNNLKQDIIFWYNSNMDRQTYFYKKSQSKSLKVIGLIVAFTLNIDSIHFFKYLSYNDDIRQNLVLVAEDYASKSQSMNESYQDAYNRYYPSLKASIDSVYKNKDSIWLNDSSDTYFNALIRSNIFDSIDKSHIKQIEEIAQLNNILGMPIGWDRYSPPLCYFYKKKALIENDKINTELSNYINKRQTDVKYGFLWLLGVLITGIMLSFGAPFWFDVLVKFVNIRKASTNPSLSSKSPQK